MRRHYTPADVAQALAPHLPVSCQRLLEPAVGSGILLEPVRARYECAPPTIVGVDIDAAALNIVAARHKDYGGNLHLIGGDFLTEGTINRVAPLGPYDCILMNPPFAAKRQDWVEVPPSTLAAYPQLAGEKISPELGFLLVALQLLAPAGRLIALVPSSVIAAAGGAWFRAALLAVGSVLTVHELSPFTFQGVEGRVYVLVFSKGERNANVSLDNHALENPEHLLLRVDELGPGYRLDFGFHQARQALGSLEGVTAEFKWRALGDLAEIIRGSVASPVGQRRALHTCDQIHGFWHVHRAINFTQGTEYATTRSGDLMTARVGRAASQSFGLVTDFGRPCSDCVFIVRPHQMSRSEHLLFATRVILGYPDVRPLLEHGCGATYIPAESLRRLRLPYGLADVYPDLFSEFRQSIVARDPVWRNQVEEETRLRLKPDLAGDRLMQSQPV